MRPPVQGDLARVLCAVADPRWCSVREHGPEDVRPDGVGPEGGMDDRLAGPELGELVSADPKLPYAPA